MCKIALAALCYGSIDSDRFFEVRPNVVRSLKFSPMKVTDAIPDTDTITRVVHITGI